MGNEQCLCGFTEQLDESLVDHLERVFMPGDMRGTDGLVHEEMGDLACACGFAGMRPGQLDTHFLAVFMTADGIGTDGQKHGIPAGVERR
jgi:hypothetical protein